MQAPELCDDEEQENAYGARRIQKILPVLQQTYDAQRIALSVRCRPVAQLARAPVSKTGGWGFDSLQACYPMVDDPLNTRDAK